jgi:hypothetical protein
VSPPERYASHARTSSRWAAAILCALCTVAGADELRPAYLEAREQAAGEFSILWKTPMQGQLRLALTPQWSGATLDLTPIVTRTTQSAAAVQTWRVRAIEPLRGQTLRIVGLEGTTTDVLARFEFADGSTWIKRLTPAEPAAAIPRESSTWSVAGEYLELGVEHILLGTDHLLFVLSLLLLCVGVWRLIKTVTAFTIAHSITLALATLGFVRVPPAPVEAVIALSIAFVAMEIIRTRQGRPGISAQAPWLVAFVFGLLHGLGFAGALSEVGLPHGHIPVALLFFNLGVEGGQLLFVAVVLAALALVRRVPAPRALSLVPPYAIGTIAMFWVIQRLAAF